MQELAGIRKLSTVDVAAVRLWLDWQVKPSTASNVMAGFDEGVGATFFDLNALQVDAQAIHCSCCKQPVEQCRRELVQCASVGAVAWGIPECVADFAGCPGLLQS